MTMQFRSAPEVEKIARDLFHEVGDFRAHRAADIEFVMSSDRPTVRGAGVPGQVKILSGAAALLSVPIPDRVSDFGLNRRQTLVVITAWPEWRFMEAGQKRGLVDHLLSHFCFDNKGWQIRYPEFGEFPRVLARNGLWRLDYERDRLPGFVRFVNEQLAMFGEYDGSDGGAENDEDAGQDGFIGEIFQGAADDMREEYADEIERGKAEITTSRDRKENR